MAVDVPVQANLPCFRGSWPAILVSALLSCALALAGCRDDGHPPPTEGAQAPRIPPEVVETPHYRIRSAASAAQTQAVADAVESLHAAYAGVFGIGQRQEHLVLVLYANQAEFKANNRSAPWAEAYYLPPRSYAYPGTGANPHHWMLHEATHQLLREASGFKLRKWINEGVASYFGAGTLRDGALDPGTPDAGAYPIWWLGAMGLSGDMQADIARGRIIPLRQIVEDTGPPIAEHVNTYYLHYWSLTHYLMHGDGGRHRAAFLALVAQGGDPEVFQRLIGPYEQVQRGWYCHLRMQAARLGGAKANGTD